MDDMFRDVKLSLANYDALLTGWSGQDVQSDVTFHGGTSNYTVQANRDILTNTPNNWTITDGGYLYPVTYHANEATGGTAPAVQGKKHGADLTLASNSRDLVRTDHDFIGWNTSADGSGVDYAEGAVYTDNAPLTLYANWKRLAPDGEGTLADPYIIATWENLYWLSQNSEEWNKYYLQTADIDFANATPEITTWDDNKGWKPIGTYDEMFVGNYKGNGHIIKNLYINRPEETGIGLFSWTNGATISDIGLLDADIHGEAYVGGLTGGNVSSTIKNCYSTGNVSGADYAGDYIGYYVGGLVGYNSGSDISNSYSTAEITGIQNVGGFIGRTDNAPISNCYSTGNVTGSGDVGGFIGYNLSSSISDSFWDTQTSGQATSAGGTGKPTAEMQDYNTFTDEATDGLTTAWDFVTSPNDDSGNADFWDMDQEGTVNSGYPILFWQDGADDILVAPSFSDGSGTLEDPYQIENWNHLNNVRDNLDAHFVLNNNLDSSTPGYDSHAASTANENQGWVPIGDSTDQFTGTFNGNNRTIHDLSINRSSEDDIGLFGQASETAEFENVQLIDADITGQDNTGGLMGANSGSVTNCSFSGSGSGRKSVGSLVGWNNGGTISNSTSSGSVQGANNVGGLVGENSGTISNSTSSGSVEGSSINVGGLVGYHFGGTISNSYGSGSVEGSDNNVGGLVGGNNDGAISNSYSSGSVEGSGDDVGGLVGLSAGTCTQSFWDTETSGLSRGVGSGDSDPDGVTGKPTAEMKTASTFTDAGWSFDDNPWTISDGNSRPFLNWQNLVVDNGAAQVSETTTAASFAYGNLANNSDDQLTLTYGYMFREDTPPVFGENDTQTKILGQEVDLDAGADLSFAGANITGLTANTTYYARAYATDNANVWYGNTVRFVTGDVPIGYALTVNNGSGSGDYEEGAEVDIQADDPSTGQEFDAWTGDSVHVADENSASTTLTMPADDIEVTATYRAQTYTVSVSAGDGGNIAPDSRNVTHGETTTFTVTPNDGYYIDEVTGCGGSLSDDTYTTGPITQACSVSASFLALEELYTLIVNSGTGNGEYVEGENVNIRADDPEGGKVFDKWTGTGASYVDNVNSSSTTLTMPAANVEVTATYKDAPEDTFALTVTNGSGDGNYTVGAVVDIQANTPPEGQMFDQWTVDTDHVDNVTSASTSVTMPAANVTVTATYKDIPEDTFTLTVNSGSGDGEYTEGVNAPIQANAPEQGKVFDKWTGNTEMVGNIMSASTTLTMPSDDVTVSATYKDSPEDTFALTVESGKGSGSYVEGQEVAIVAETPDEGRVFDKWTGTGADSVANKNIRNTSLAMPGENIVVTATYKDKPEETFLLSVHNGTGGGSRHSVGATISIAAAPPADGKIFHQWTGNTETVANDKLANTSLTMPASDVDLTATYKDKPAEEFDLKVNEGTGGGKYKAGDLVAIAADIPTDDDKIFDQWTGDTATVANVFTPNTTMVMPDSDVDLTATYKDKPAIDFNLSVNSGTGGGKYKAGDVAAIAADVIPEGEDSVDADQVFDQWIGDIEHVENVNAPNTTVTMPDNDVTITATYKDAPEDTFTVTVTSGTINNGTESSGEFRAGRVVRVTADAAQDGGRDHHGHVPGDSGGGLYLDR